MHWLLALARSIDRLSDRFGALAKWAVLASCLVSAGNATVRYAANYSSNALLEFQWYMLAACVMFGAAQVLRLNEHVRVDILYGRASHRARAWIDIFGLACFLVPTALVLLYFSVPMAVAMARSGEVSGNAGGLVRWPAMATLPIGAALLLLQAAAEIVKRAAWLGGHFDLDLSYEKPEQ